MLPLAPHHILDPGQRGYGIQSNTQVLNMLPQFRSYAQAAWFVGKVVKALPHLFSPQQHAHLVLPAIAQ